jgi:hypothetical protein
MKRITLLTIFISCIFYKLQADDFIIKEDKEGKITFVSNSIVKEGDIVIVNPKEEAKEPEKKRQTIKEKKALKKDAKSKEDAKGKENESTQKAAVIPANTMMLDKIKENYNYFFKVLTSNDTSERLRYINVKVNPSVFLSPYKVSEIKGKDIFTYLSNYLVKDKQNTITINLNKTGDMKIAPGENSITIIKGNEKNIKLHAFFKDLSENDINYRPFSNYLHKTELLMFFDRMTPLYNKITYLDSTFSELELIPLADEIRDFTTSNSYQDFVQRMNKAIESNKVWINATAWINNYPTMNPLGIVDTAELKKENETYQEQLTELKDINEQRTKCIDCKTTDPKWSTYSLKDYYTDEIKVAIVNLTAMIEKNNTLIKENTARLNNLAEKETILNELKIYASNNKLGAKSKTVFMRLHNAFDKFNFKKYDKPFEKERYVESEELKTVVYNIPENVTITYTDSVYSIEETEIFTEHAKKQVGAFNTFLNSDAIKNLRTNPLAGDERENAAPLIALVNDFIREYAKVKWLLDQTVPSDLPELKTYGPKYRSEVFEASEKKEQSYVVKYTFTSTKKDEAKPIAKNTFKYTVYKKQYIQFTAGIMYLPNNNNNERIQSEYKNGSFSSKSLKPYDVVAGVKIYPFGLNVRRWFPVVNTARGNRKILFKRGDLLINRVSLFAGLSVSQEQLRNYFVGGGFEIVPGLGLNVGANFYTTKTYKFDNGVMTKEKEVFKKPSYYVGLTLDPIVLFQVTGILKIK